MRPARRPRARSEHRLLVLEENHARDEIRDTWFSRLPEFLRSGDLLVLNDAATLPASFYARNEAGERIEFRLMAETSEARRLAVAFRDGSWRERTEHRERPSFREGERLRWETSELEIRILSSSPVSGAWVEIEFRERDRPATKKRILRELYAGARVIQYSHLEDDLDLWDVQTIYASRPWAFEMPSAGRPFSWELLFRLIRKGVRLAPLTHATGLSSTGVPEIDSRLPLPERLEIPEATVRTIEETRARGGRVIAVGTSVTRALEGTFHAHGRLQSGRGETDLILSPRHQLRVVDGILSGMHESTETHYELLGSFFPEPQLNRLLERAEYADFLTHEFGDSCLLLPDRERISA